MEEKEKLVDELVLPMCDYYNSSEVIKDNIKEICKQSIRSFIHKYQFYFKNTSFEYENEYRIILHIPCDSTEEYENISERKFRNKNGIIIPYVEYQFDKSAIRKICIAVMPESHLAEKTLRNYLDSHGYNSIDIIKSSAPIRLQ